MQHPALLATCGCDEKAARLEREMLATTLVSNKTTPEERKLLRDNGFVHVTGLTESYPDGSDPSVIYGEDDQLGRHDYGNGPVVIVTEGGEVWLGGPGEHARSWPEPISPETSSRWFHRRVDPLFEKFCPNGRGVSVPCSSGKVIAINDLLDRLANPDFQPFPR